MQSPVRWPSSPTGFFFVAARRRFARRRCCARRRPPPQRYGDRALARARAPRSEDKPPRRPSYAGGLGSAGIPWSPRYNIWLLGAQTLGVFARVSWLADEPVSVANEGCHGHGRG